MIPKILNLAPLKLGLIRLHSWNLEQVSRDSAWRIKFDLKPIWGLHFACNTPKLVCEEMTVSVEKNSFWVEGLLLLVTENARFEEDFWEWAWCSLCILCFRRTQKSDLLLSMRCLLSIFKVSKSTCFGHKPLLSSLPKKMYHYHHTFIPRISGYYLGSFCQAWFTIPKFNNITLDFLKEHKS